MTQSRPAPGVREWIFWTHLAVGVSAGLMIFSLSATGALLAFQPQIVAWAERDYRIDPPAGAARLDPETLAAKAAQAAPGPFTGLTLRRDPSAPAVVNFERRNIFLNPYTGQVLGEGAKELRKFFAAATDWHRSLGAGKAGRRVTGVCTAGLLGLTLSGLVLWWPRGRSAQAFKAALVLRGGPAGKARDWNWHTVVGFWCSLALMAIALSGLVLSFPWASGLIFHLTGTEDAVAASRPPRGPEDSSVQPVPLNALWARAEALAPQWRFISLRPPQKGSRHAYVSIEESDSAHPYPRSLLTLDPQTGETVAWDRFADYNAGRRLRAWARPLHTGEAGGVAGQTLALAASLGGILLVWTGFALAFRRFRS